MVCPTQCIIMPNNYSGKKKIFFFINIFLGLGSVLLGQRLTYSQKPIYSPDSNLNYSTENN